MSEDELLATYDCGGFTDGKSIAALFAWRRSAADERVMAAIARLVVVHGRVQGVGYRDAAVQAAFTIDVSGWVRNRRDGTVEAHAQGAPDAVERFVEWCRRGPPLARVSNVDATARSRSDPALRDFAWRVERVA